MKWRRINETAAVGREVFDREATGKEAFGRVRSEDLPC
jgi:hypothetical protein